jgi:hypothetical protein
MNQPSEGQRYKRTLVVVFLPCALLMTACVREPSGSPDRVEAGIQGIRGEMVIRGTPGTETVVDFELAEEGSW